VPIQKDAKLNDPYADIRAAWDRRLEILNEPSATEKLNEIFSLSPQEIADAANRGARRRKG
jgi:hypothetical protein